MPPPPNLVWWFLMSRSRHHFSPPRSRHLGMVASDLKELWKTSNGAKEVHGVSQWTPGDAWEDSSDWEQRETLLIRSSSGARSLHLDPPERRKKKKKVMTVSEEERWRKICIAHQVNHNNEVLMIRSGARFCSCSRWKTTP